MSKRSFSIQEKIYYVAYIILVSITIILYLIFRMNSMSLVLGAIISISIVAFLQWQFRVARKQSVSHSLLESSVSFEESKNQAFPEFSSTSIKETSPMKKVDVLVFQVNTSLANLNDFYGRNFEYRKIVDRIKKGASTSIVGEPKSGKTWLLTYTYLRVRNEFNSSEIKAGYIDAAELKVRTIAGFTNAVLHMLSFSSTFTLPDDHSLAFLDAYISDLVEEGQTPVLFIDNFEAFTQQKEFNSRFFEALRAMTQIGLVLITASRQPLIKIVSKSTNRSPFFNVFDQIKLSSFDFSEAQEFVRSKALQAEFTEQEQEDMLRYGQDNSGRWPPLRLQLVGNVLLEKRDKDDFGYEYDTLKSPQEFKRQIEKEYSMLNAQ